VREFNVHHLFVNYLYNVLRYPYEDSMSSLSRVRD
jgi:hypothetical protein